MSVPREIVKLRKVAGSMVISIPQSILFETQIVEGDRVLIECITGTRLMLTKEGKNMPNVQRAELELAVLQAQKEAHISSAEYLVWQRDNPTVCSTSLLSSDILHQQMLERKREAADLEVEIAKKRLEIFELQGSIPAAKQGG